jgi:hypothetical protein
VIREEQRGDLRSTTCENRPCIERIRPIVAAAHQQDNSCSGDTMFDIGEDGGACARKTERCALHQGAFGQFLHQCRFSFSH